MFRITEDPSSGSLVQCLAKNYINGSIVSVDMDVVGVMAAYAAAICCHTDNYSNYTPREEQIFLFVNRKCPIVVMCSLSGPR